MESIQPWSKLDEKYDLKNYLEEKYKNIKKKGGIFVYKTFNKQDKTWSALKLIYRVKLDRILSEMVEALAVVRINT